MSFFVCVGYVFVEEVGILVVDVVFYDESIDSVEGGNGFGVKFGWFLEDGFVYGVELEFVMDVVVFC